MYNQIVFADSQRELEEEFDNIIEWYDFREEGVAALVEVSDHNDIMAAHKSDHPNYTENEEFKLLWELDEIDYEANERAGIENVRSMHEAPVKNGDGTNQTVVVMDSGIDDSHSVFDDTPVVERFDATDSGGVDSVGHGTACAGQVAHIAPNAELIDLRIFGSSGYTTMSTILKAYEWLLDNSDRIDVVNMSWGSSDTIEDINRIHRTLLNRDIRDVIAAGNSGSEGGSPATAEGAFSAGACTKYGEMASFSSYNPDYGNPDVTAIGRNNVLARASGAEMGVPIDDSWVVASGTSFAAPIVAGLVAKYRSVNPTASVDDAAKAFTDSSTEMLDVPEGGAGIVKYLPAVRYGSRGEKADEDVSTVPATVWAFAGRDSLYVHEDILPSGKYEVDPEKFEAAFTKRDE